MASLMDPLMASLMAPLMAQMEEHTLFCPVHVAGVCDVCPSRSVLAVAVHFCVLPLGKGEGRGRERGRGRGRGGEGEVRGEGEGEGRGRGGVMVECGHATTLIAAWCNPAQSCS